MDMKLPEAPFVGASSMPGRRRRCIGEILVESGRLDPKGALGIAKLQRELGLRFGEAAVRSNLLQPADIEFALSQQFSYPYLAPGTTSLSPSVVCAFQPFGAVAEQLRSVRTRIGMLAAQASGTMRSLAVVSPGRKEGRSFIAANLAVVFAQMGERVLLIDADLREPVQHRLFGVENRIGLSHALLGHADIDGAARVPEFENLSILPAGSRAPNPQELLSWPSLSALLAEASADYDKIIIDTAATERAADAHLVAARAASTLLVARADATNANQLNRLWVSLRESGANVVGAVLNDAR